jgi:hypothetical protein
VLNPYGKTMCDSAPGQPAGLCLYECSVFGMSEHTIGDYWGLLTCFTKHNILKVTPDACKSEYARDGAFQFLDLRTMQ